MRHAVVGSKGDIVTGFDELAIWETLGVPLHNLLGQRLRCGGCCCGLVKKLGRGVLELRGKGAGDICESCWTGGGHVPWVVVEVEAEAEL